MRKTKQKIDGERNVGRLKWGVGREKKKGGGEMTGREGGGGQEQCMEGVGGGEAEEGRSD